MDATGSKNLGIMIILGSGEFIIVAVYHKRIWCLHSRWRGFRQQVSDGELAWELTLGVASLNINGLQKINR